MTRFHSLDLNFKISGDLVEKTRLVRLMTRVTRVEFRKSSAISSCTETDFITETTKKLQKVIFGLWIRFKTTKKREKYEKSHKKKDLERSML